MYILSDRTRFEWVKKQLLKLPRGQSILDAGAGELKYKEFCNHLKYVSQDFGEYKGGKGPAGLHPKSWNTSKVDIISDIIDMPVKDRSFDNVLCSEVLEHVPYPELTIKELSRVLKKGGKLILTAPFCAQTHFAPYFYHTGFSRYWYQEIFKKYNLKIVRFTPNGNFFDYLVQELLRFPLMVKRHSFLGWFAVFLYAIVLPFVVLMIIISKISKNSEYQLCFGWHVIAKKI